MSEKTLWEGLPEDVATILKEAQLKPESDDYYPWDLTHRCQLAVGEVLKKTLDVQKALSALLHEDMWQLLDEDYFGGFSTAEIPELEGAVDNLTTTEQIDLLLHIIDLSSHNLEEASHYGVVFEKLLREDMPLVVNDRFKPLVELLIFTTRRTVYNDRRSGGDTGAISGGLLLLQELIREEERYKGFLSPINVLVYETDFPNNLTCKEVDGDLAEAKQAFENAKEGLGPESDDDLSDQTPTGYGTLMWTIPG